MGSITSFGAVCHLRSLILSQILSSFMRFYWIFYLRKPSEISHQVKCLAVSWAA